jgi:hypothetical protein
MQIMYASQIGATDHDIRKAFENSMSAIVAAHAWADDVISIISVYVRENENGRDQWISFVIATLDGGKTRSELAIEAETETKTAVVRRIKNLCAAADRANVTRITARTPMGELAETSHGALEDEAEAQFWDQPS